MHVGLNCSGNEGKKNKREGKKGKRKGKIRDRESCSSFFILFFKIGDLR